MLLILLMLLSAQPAFPSGGLHLGGVVKHVDQECLTGSMTDVQSWVGPDGHLLMDVDLFKNGIDLAGLSDPDVKLRFFLQENPNHTFRYISMARCKLRSVPYLYGNCSRVTGTLQYLSLYGNHFDSDADGEELRVTITSEVIHNGTLQKHSVDNTTKPDPNQVPHWYSGFETANLTGLLELDLRACSIRYIKNDTFSRMVSLRALYLSENRIHKIEPSAFQGMLRLVHLDLSRNAASTAITWGLNVFTGLASLLSLDLSFADLSQDLAFADMSGQTMMLGHVKPRMFGSRLKTLSICNTHLRSIQGLTEVFQELENLDVSGNVGILDDVDSLTKAQKSLKVVYANDVGLHSLDVFVNFTSLVIVKATKNYIEDIGNETAMSFRNLKVLDLDHNRMKGWTQSTFSLMPNLDVLLLKSNQVTMIQEEMLQDIANVSYIGIKDNFVICSCSVRDFLDIAIRNDVEKKFHSKPLFPTIYTSQEFHRAYDEYSRLVHNRKPLKIECDNEPCEIKEPSIDGKFVILDYENESTDYQCYSLADYRQIPFLMDTPCSHHRGGDYLDTIEDTSQLVVLMVCLALLAATIGIAVIFRKRIIYFCVTVKNSALLSSMTTANGFQESSTYHYDVFVSYCNEDRPWVLDHLLPHVEKHCNVSVCLHERDFLVGLSILENIVSCMDRSKSILLVISQRFLLSQWCQFEMHLAQHRLLETRREDLILVLLEDIPRPMRPNTLHYLMLTKTYVLWPKEKAERRIFWRRLQKCIVLQKLRKNETESLA
nr:Toll-6 [Plutella xylostella]